LQRVVGMVDRRGEPIVPGQPQQIGKLGHRLEEKTGLRVDNLLVAKNTFPAGPGSSPTAVGRTASRNAAASSPHAISWTAMAAHLRAWRDRRQPAQAGVERARSSSDFRAMPAEKAAASASGSRPRGNSQPGGAAMKVGAATGEATGNP
jgi:hypothetical protein